MESIYIAGPMRNQPQLNHPAFNAAANRLRGLGFTVFNPAELDIAAGADIDAPVTNDMLRRYIHRDMAALTYADAILLLPGWRKSAGARAEVMVAFLLGLAFVELNAYAHIKILSSDDVMRRMLESQALALQNTIPLFEETVGTIKRNFP